MTNTELLKDYISKSGYKLGYLANQVGISRFSLTQKINNKSEFKANEMDALSRLLGIKNKEQIFFAK